MRKKIKGYALVQCELKEIENESYFCDSGCGCCCGDEPQSLAIYESKSIALGHAKYNSQYDVVPCEITYTLPSPKKPLKNKNI